MDSKNGENVIQREREEEIERYKRVCEEYLEGWKRAKADFVNYKKEEEERMVRAIKFSNEKLIAELIPVLESLDESLKSFSEENPATEGIKLIKVQLETIFKRNGLEKLEPAPGSKFDLAIAEAVGEVDSNEPAGTVHKTTVPGYRLYEKVIKPARVLVSKGRDNITTKQHNNKTTE